jgi:hypothetical protein
MLTRNPEHFVGSLDPPSAVSIALALPSILLPSGSRSLSDYSIKKTKEYCSGKLTMSFFTELPTA